ncbi:hypothetical protein NDU88_002555 [Pleurodeles waltl]|uniref:Uncharacterized protein n=1 Tax=Pleurodeles waltl TaxID=8319 RepID=A0AAV7RG21_PLEWA|nr:hypothetical protein NDU88_002555 [Pleurodeles waltl]
MGEEELGGVYMAGVPFPHTHDRGRVIQGYHTEARRIRWGKVLHNLQHVYGSQRNDHQLKHRWADFITREKDLLGHLGIVIGGPVGQPTGIGSTRPQTSSAGTQTAPAATVDPAAFQAMERKMDRLLRKISHLIRDVRNMNSRVRSIKRTLRRANL